MSNKRLNGTKKISSNYIHTHQTMEHKKKRLFVVVVVFSQIFTLVYIQCAVLECICRDKITKTTTMSSNTFDNKWHIRCTKKTTGTIQLRKKRMNKWNRNDSMNAFYIVAYSFCFSSSFICCLLFNGFFCTQMICVTFLFLAFSQIKEKHWKKCSIDWSLKVPIKSPQFLNCILLQCV